MKRQITLILILIVLVIGVIAFFDWGDKEENIKFEDLGYINYDWGYGFNPPKDFYLYQEMFFNQSVMFKCHPDGNKAGELSLFLYATNISNKITFPYSSIDEWKEKTLDDLTESSDIERKNISLVSLNSRTLDGKDYVEVTLETTSDEDQTSYWRIIRVMQGDRYLDVQIMGPSDLFNSYINQIDESLNSIMIVDIEEEEWDLEKYYSEDGELNNTYIMTAEEHYEDRRPVLYFSNIRIIYTTANDGDTIIIKDNISNLSYDEISDTTTIAFEWERYGSIDTSSFLFEGNITNQYSAGDRVNITVTIKRVTFLYEGINYDLEIYAENWVNVDYFQDKTTLLDNIDQGFKPLPSDIIEIV